MRTIRSLFTHEGTIWIYLENEAVGRLFLKNAEEEGFTFGDGARPTERHVSDIIALHRDMTINYVGAVGHTAFQCADFVSDEPLVRVDYGMYSAGRDDYVMSAGQGCGFQV